MNTRSSSGLGVSFEFFPPKTPEMEKSLWKAIARLEPLGPRFVSVTYGAGGSTRQRTHDTVARIARETGMAPAAHLTCVGASREEVNAVARDYHAAGIRRIVALRGDPPEGEEHFTPAPGGYGSSVELIEGLREIADFEIYAAAYPEIHPEARSAQADLDFLKRKVDAGASLLITQFFFDAEIFLRFRDRAAAAGIEVPIVPGILPVTNFRTVQRFAAMCGASVPAWMAHMFEDLDNDPATRQMVAAVTAAELCSRLREAGVRDFHFYTLNRADLTYAICHILGVRGAASPIEFRDKDTK